jgi:hypothetical protein
MPDGIKTDKTKAQEQHQMVHDKGVLVIIQRPDNSYSKVQG